MDAGTLAKIARLSRLRLSPEEQARAAQELSSIFRWIEQLQTVNTEHAPEMTGVDQGALRMREDTVTDGNLQEAVLANAPSAAFGCFAVPKVVE